MSCLFGFNILGDLRRHLITEAYSVVAIVSAHLVGLEEKVTSSGVEGLTGHCYWHFSVAEQNQLFSRSIFSVVPSEI